MPSPRPLRTLVLTPEEPDCWLLTINVPYSPSQSTERFAIQWFTGSSYSHSAGGGEAV